MWKGFPSLRNASASRRGEPRNWTPDCVKEDSWLIVALLGSHDETSKQVIRTSIDGWINTRIFPPGRFIARAMNLAIGTATLILRPSARDCA